MIAQTSRSVTLRHVVCLCCVRDVPAPGMPFRHLSARELLSQEASVIRQVDDSGTLEQVFLRCMMPAYQLLDTVVCLTA